ncbi:MAG: hypothetical protein ACLQIJ_17275 [Polyangia bacterium]
MSACSGSDSDGTGADAGASTGGTGPLTSAGAGAGMGGSTLGGNTGAGGVASAGATTTAGGTTVAGGQVSIGGRPGGSRSTGSVTITGGTTSTGGDSNAGGTVSTGGTMTTGGARTTGGASSAGGTPGGSQASGGAVGAGGSSATAGTTSAAGSTASAGTAGSGGAAGAGGVPGTSSGCPGADAAEFALVQAWLNNTIAVGALPNYAYSNIKTNFPAGAAFDKLACSIAMSCVEFAPMETDWLRKCEAVVTSAIVAESSYNPNSVVTDSYATRALTGATANDPTVGLLQVRFSSTMHDFNYNGPMAKMAALGCTWPPELQTQPDTTNFWATEGGTTYLSFMQDVACNIGSAAWYYFYNATGNGGASAVWISNYCAGQGIAGTMVTGLLSHLEGGNYPRPADPNNPYPWGIECCSCGNPSGCTCTGCTGRFAAFMGIGTTASRPTPDPFQEVLSPEPTKYCK